MSVSSLRKAVWNAIVKWYEDYITIRYEMPNDDTDDTTKQNSDEHKNGEEVSTSSESVPSVTVPTKIETFKKPTYLPAGVEEELVIQSSSMLMYEYYNGDDFVFYYSQTAYKEDNKYLDSETAMVKEINVGEYRFLLVEYDGNPEKVLLWDDKMYLYRVVFESESIEEMIKVAQSVQ